jgi:hypothetical protein
MTDCFGKSGNDYDKVSLTWALMLAENALDDRKLLIVWGTDAVRADQYAPWNHTVLAGAYLRNGEYESALRCLDDSDRLAGAWPSRVVNDLVRAIALLRIGRSVEGKSVFDSAARYCDDRLKPTSVTPYGDLSGGPWWDWYTIQLFRREAERLLRDASKF